MTNTKIKYKSIVEDYHLLSYQELDSSNEEAKRLAVGGASHGAVIWAKSQTSGKGRLGREWISEKGNLFVSVLLSPEKSIDELAQLSFVTSLAVLEMLELIVDGSCKLQLKWPNDILLDGKKLGGILLESFESAGKRWVAIGVGLNIDSFPQNVAYPATCLTKSGVHLISAKIVLSRFIHHFIGMYDNWNNEGFADIREKWIEHGYLIGENIKINSHDEVIEGLFKGIDSEGRMLMLKDGDEEIIIIHAGDLHAADH